MCYSGGMTQSIAVSVLPTFHLSLTRATVQALIATAQSHYDGVCKSYAGPDGLLTRWDKICAVYEDAEYEDEADRTQPTFFNTTWRELDTIGKICEMARGDNAATVAAVYFAIIQSFKAYQNSQKTSDIIIPINA